MPNDDLSDYLNTHYGSATAYRGMCAWIGIAEAEITWPFTGDWSDWWSTADQDRQLACARQLLLDRPGDSTVIAWLGAQKIAPPSSDSEHLTIEAYLDWLPSWAEAGNQDLLTALLGCSSPDHGLAALAPALDRQLGGGLRASLLVAKDQQPAEIPVQARLATQLLTVIEALPSRWELPDHLQAARCSMPAQPLQAWLSELARLPAGDDVIIPGPPPLLEQTWATWPTLLEEPTQQADIGLLHYATQFLGPDAVAMDIASAVLLLQSLVWGLRAHPDDPDPDPTPSDQGGNDEEAAQATAAAAGSTHA